MTQEVWIVAGKVTNPDSPHYGQDEYIFSDVPPGQQGNSANYVTLSKGLKDHSGCIIHWGGDWKAYRVEATIRERRLVDVVTTIWANSPEEAARVVKMTKYDDFVVDNWTADDWEIYEVIDVAEI